MNIWREVMCFTIQNHILIRNKCQLSKPFFEKYYSARMYLFKMQLFLNVVKLYLKFSDFSNHLCTSDVRKVLHTASNMWPSTA